MSAQTTNRILITLSSLVLLVTVAVVVLGFRSEDTRNIVERSPCQVDPSSENCQRLTRETSREKSIRDSCIPFRKVMTSTAYRRNTICAKRGVFVENSQRTRDSFGKNGVAANPPPKDSPGTERAEEQQKRDNATPPSATEQPPQGNKPPAKPSAPSLPKPTVTLPGVSVNVVPSGTCVNALGVKVALGSC